MAKSPPQQVDVLVLGEHPAAYLAAALLRHKSRLRVVHATIPGPQPPDRLVLVNPAFYKLHPLLEPLRRKLRANGIYGLQFLADDGTRAEYRSKSAVNAVASLKDVRLAVEKVAAVQGVEFRRPRSLQVQRVHEEGLDFLIDGRPLFPRALILGGALPPDQQKVLGLHEEWERGIVHRYTCARIRSARVELGSRPLMPMSLDLGRRLTWAWLLPGVRSVQLAVEQPLDSIHQVNPHDLLLHWANVLHRHGVLKTSTPVDRSCIEWLDLPLGGALAHEGLASRTLLVGPAGGFYSASGEDIYPNCWSAVFAASLLKSAWKETHLQDALQPYRQMWRTTLGDYLRGPQQNLRWLLPLVYRNQIMTNRLAEAILVGRSVVR
jgi:hypothetical protein